MFEPTHEPLARCFDSVQRSPDGKRRRPTSRSDRESSFGLALRLVSRLDDAARHCAGLERFALHRPERLHRFHLFDFGLVGGFHSVGADSTRLRSRLEFPSSLHDGDGRAGLRAESGRSRSRSSRAQTPSESDQSVQSEKSASIGVDHAEAFDQRADRQSAVALGVDDGLSSSRRDETFARFLPFQQEQTLNRLIEQYENTATNEPFEFERLIVAEDAEEEEEEEEDDDDEDEQRTRSPVASNNQ